MISKNQLSGSQGKNQPQSMSTTSADMSRPGSMSVETKVPAPTDYRPEMKSTESRPEMKSKNSSNPALSRALVGGLIGATVGLLAGRKLSEGFNRASKGVGKAFGTIGQGLGTTAKGVSEAAKSIGDGVSYAVVGGTSDIAQNLAEGVQQVASGTSKAIKQTSEAASQTIDNVAKSVQPSTSETGQSVIGSSETEKSMAVDIDELERSGFDSGTVGQPYIPPITLSEDDATVAMELYESIDQPE